MRVRPQPKLVDFHDAENRKWPRRMIMWHVKDLLSFYLAWMLLAKLKSQVQFRIARAQVLPSGEETGHQIICGDWHPPI
ncbi:hypothetical protein TNCV_5000411 [Trichonephila clavipes]|nr:hypothetical protein TNCV_5000411 [Trichonephila clavipes]